MSWETTIGLEIHVQLSTKTKLFSGASTQFGSNPNSQVDYVDLGLPGVLPVPNREAFNKAIMFGLATNSTINNVSLFDRKNYFYPDLPKGYQITQMNKPIVENGEIAIYVGNKEKIINITRAHLEEDAGKSVHDLFDGKTGVDLNRAGTPLLEIVSEPEISSPEEAVAYFKAIHQLVTYLDICDGNMSQGSMRCDVNVSIKKPEDTELGTRAELKNINSFRFIDRAIRHEVNRQIKLLEKGEKIVQETRLYDSDKNETRSMRSKEAANDYRYFPEPDLLPIVIDQNEINEIKNNMPELPKAKVSRYIDVFNLDEADAKIIATSKEMSKMFETAAAESMNPQLAARWLIGEVNALLNKDNVLLSESKLKINNFASLIIRINDETISGKIAKTVLEKIWETGDAVDSIIESEGLVQIKDSGLIEEICNKVVSENPDQVAAYKAGKDKLFGFFVGQVMKESKGKANPKNVNEVLKKLLS